ncbi:MAG: glycosyltransferase family 4 protein [Candidatus Pacebacteria bacterium]|nr:glycosyltransferase family 4 protein [Candidatus Paceibacterota bacterium]
MDNGRYIQEAKETLDAILRAERVASQKATESVESIQAARKKPVADLTSNRTKTRVLFITTDINILNQATKSLDGFTAVNDLFHEVHIMVLRTGIKSRNPVLRIEENTWLYTVTATYAWQLPFFAWSALERELVFADGFRPDIVVALDVGASAFCAYGAGMYYNRSIQIHISKQYQSPVKWLARWFHNWLIRRFLSIRVTTEELVAAYRKQFGPEYDISILPIYRGYLADFTGQQGVYLKKKYPQFNFIVLYVGDLTATSTAFGTIDLMRGVLRNPRVGFLMVGNGTGVMECERRAELLGIKDQVIIERRADDIKQYVESADVLIVTDTDSAADEVTLFGAAAGTPTIMTKTNLREDIFQDGESAFIVSDVRSSRINEVLLRLLNSNSERLLMREKSRQAVLRRLVNGQQDYEKLYRESIESALYFGVDR